MAWTKTNLRNKQAHDTETYTLPASAVAGYSSVIDWVNVDRSNDHNWVSLKFHPTAITGTNLDIALYGSDTLAGTTKYLLKDAIVADLTADDTVVCGNIDFNLYPSPYYFLAWTADVNESANTIAVSVIH